MRLTNPAGLWALALAVPILLLHVLRPRRAPFTVSSTFLWDRVEKPVSASAPWQKLRWSVLLILQLLIVALLALALARPASVTAAPLAKHTVFVVDVSGSMAARDGAGDGAQHRLDRAKAIARQLRAELPSGGQASVVLAGPQPRVVLSTSSDRSAFDAALRRVAITPGRPDWSTAFSLAAGLDMPGSPLGIILLSDGRMAPEDRRAIPPGTVWRKVGSRDVNRAIARVVVEPRGARSLIRVTLRNTGGPDASQLLRIDVDGRTATRTRVRIPRAATVEREVSVRAGDRVEVFLEGDDLLPIDDHAFAATTTRKTLRVLYAGPGDQFLERLLRAMPGVVLHTTTASRPADGYDLGVYDRVRVPADPGAPFLAVSPPGGVDGVSVVGEVEQPAVTLVRTDHPLLSGLDLSTVGIAIAQRIRLGDPVGAAAPSGPATVALGDAPIADADPLIASEDTPLLLRGTAGGQRFVYLGFAVSDSTWPLQLSFPLLGDRIVQELTGSDTNDAEVHVGDVIPVPTDRAVTVVEPDGKGTAVRVGAASVIAERTGFWRVREPGKPDRLVPVNADPYESAISPANSLPIAAASRVREARLAGERPLLRWVLLALLALLAVEWLVARRSRGVGKRQWQTARVVRLAGVASLAASALGLTVPLAGRGVSVLFVVDSSDSVGQSGKDAAFEWVREALESKPRGAKAGVAVFGADARLELSVQQRLALDEPLVHIDGSRTNAATALRLGAAVLPSAQRRRIVLLSDGRFTDGDAEGEAKRLRREGVRVDAHLMQRPVGPDVSLTQLEVPPLVRVGETYSVRVVASATEAGSGVLRLYRNDRLVERRNVSLRRGENTFEISQAVRNDSGVASYRAEIRLPGDLLSQNDTAFSAAAIQGPPRVLVVRGNPDESGSLVDALRSQQMIVEETDPATMPAFESLIGFDSTVLVDVDARSLTSTQIDSLSVMTRDLGRGLVVIGGRQSFGLGGYRRSELETLLPLDSEILDPKRRKSVAEVLAIDTSGSMSTCHCANEVGARVSGGVDKTDISRSAAARAIAALSPSDHVGVLAFTDTEQWIIPLQQGPDPADVARKLGNMAAEGQTNLTTPLLTAAEELRNTKAQLKHIVLFTDGFTDEADLLALRDQAATLSAQGITVSVLGTGEGASELLQGVADAGRGRFYPGTDLESIPDIMAEETVIASRSFINEGRFVPKVVGAGAPVRTLTEAPPLLGYIATTAKPTAETWLRVGPENDPLLASWRAGLGKVTAWTSDSADPWSQNWARWDGYPAFWAAVVKDTFPAQGGALATLRTEPNGRGFRILLESPQPLPDGARASLRVSEPGLRARSGSSAPIRMERVSATVFAAEVDAVKAGTYALGSVVNDRSGKVVATASRLASRSYSAEYRPGAADRNALVKVSRAAAGRGFISPGSAFESKGLPKGRSNVPLAGWFLLASALLFPIDAALRRLLLRREAIVGAATGASAPWRRRRKPPVPDFRLRRSPPVAPAPSGRSGTPPMSAKGSTVSSSEGSVESSVPEPPVPEPPEPEPPEPLDRAAGALDRLLGDKRKRNTK